MNATFQTSFVLHSRPYKETSALVDFFTPEGRYRAVLRKARSKVGSIGRPFMPLEISLYGKGELKTVGYIECIAAPYKLMGNNLFCGLYLNELLVRLLPLEDAMPSLFKLYQQTLTYLAYETHIEPLLRSFEWQLVNELGYGFSLMETGEGQPIKADSYYLFTMESGLQEISQFQAGAFHGREILTMSMADWTDKAALAAAKRLMRQILTIHLQGKPLVSRELFK